jgi:hypothetical protein
MLRPQDDDWLSPIARGIDALHFMAQGSQLASDAYRLVERLKFGVNKYIETFTERTTEQQAASAPPHGLVLSDGGLTTLTEAMPESAVHEDTPSINAMPHLAPFADLEPSLLAYSEEELALFGFNGFESIIDLDDSTWIWETYLGGNPHSV